MAIHEVTKMWSRNSSSASATDNGRGFEISFREAYQITHDPGTTLYEIYTTSQGPNPLPAINSPFPKTINPANGTPLTFFEFVFYRAATPTMVSPVMTIMEYDASGAFGPGGPQDSPLNTPPKINWTDAETDEPIDVDFDGNPIVTINNEPIEGVTTKIADQVVTIQRNYADFSPYATAAYRRSVSSDTFLGYPAGTAKMIRFNAQQIIGEGASAYWDVTASIQFRLPYRTTNDKAWYARVLHQGFYIKSGSNVIRATDSNGEPVVKQVLLKADGTRETNPANATFREFKRYGALPYNALGLL
jgi:hypothetical protein